MSMQKTGKGRILRVKTGYNPNSSSVGSQIPAFLAFAAGSGAFTIMGLHVFNAVDKRIRKKNNVENVPTAPLQEEMTDLSDRL